MITRLAVMDMYNRIVSASRAHVDDKKPNRYHPSNRLKKNIAPVANLTLRSMCMEANIDPSHPKPIT